MVLKSQNAQTYFSTQLQQSLKKKKKHLRNQEGEEGSKVTLHAKLSKHNALVKWKKGSVLLQASNKYEMKQMDSAVELFIHDLQLKDAGGYICDSGDEQTMASLVVKGDKKLSLHLLGS